MNSTAELFANSIDARATAAVIAAGGDADLMHDAVIELADLLHDERRHYVRQICHADTLALEFDEYRLTYAPRDCVVAYAEDSSFSVSVWYLFDSSRDAFIDNEELRGGTPVYEYTVQDLIDGGSHTRVVYGRREALNSVLDMLDALGGGAELARELRSQFS